MKLGEHGFRPRATSCTFKSSSELSLDAGDEPLDPHGSACRLLALELSYGLPSIAVRDVEIDGSAHEERHAHDRHESGDVLPDDAPSPWRAAEPAAALHFTE